MVNTTFNFLQNCQIISQTIPGHPHQQCVEFQSLPPSSSTWYCNLPNLSRSNQCPVLSRHSVTGTFPILTMLSIFYVFIIHTSSLAKCLFLSSFKKVYFCCSKCFPFGTLKMLVHCLLVSLVSDDKFIVIQTVVPLLGMYLMFFALDAFKIFLCLVISNLTILDFSVFMLLGLTEIPESIKLGLLAILVNFGHYFFIQFFFHSLSGHFFWISNYIYYTLRFLRFCSSFFPSICSLSSSDMIISIFKVIKVFLYLHSAIKPLQ